MRAVLGLIIFSAVALISFTLLEVLTRLDVAVKVLAAIGIGIFTEIFYYRFKQKNDHT